ncbi:MAG TPA: hypothetical protein VF487_13205 [Chitinophagaceae bacterium]
MAKPVDSLNPEQSESKSATEKFKSVTLKLALDRAIFNRLKKFSSDNGLAKEQDIIRLAVSTFLTKMGY